MTLPKTMRRGKEKKRVREKWERERRKVLRESELARWCGFAAAARDCRGRTFYQKFLLKPLPARRRTDGSCVRRRRIKWAVPRVDASVMLPLRRNAAKEEEPRLSLGSLGMRSESYLIPSLCCAAIPPRIHAARLNSRERHSLGLIRESLHRESSSSRRDEKPRRASDGARETRYIRSRTFPVYIIYMRVSIS